MKKITVSFLVDDRTDKLIRNFAVNRVLNTAVGIFEDMADGVLEDDTIADLNDFHIEDLYICKPIIETMWNAVFNALFIETYPKERIQQKIDAMDYARDHPLTIRAGD